MTESAGRRHWRTRPILFLALVVSLLAGCSSPLGPAAPRPTACGVSGCNHRDFGSAPAPCVTSTCAARKVQVFVEPDAGEAPILRAIASAQHTLWVEVYILSDRNVIRALEDAAQRGVEAHVLLETHPYGGGDV